MKRKMRPEGHAVSDRTAMGIDELLRAACALDADGQPDGQLLGRFLAQRDESAFAALVRRHGPMVLSVCRRILGHAEDAEDAFQATFIVLVRKAASLTSRAVLGDWLHGVARRTALNARRAATRRRRKEEAMAQLETQREEVRDNGLSLLDELLSRLPEKYRLAIVLCELEGYTRREAAEQLGWPEGTVAGRLARGRALLAKKLIRRGPTLSAASTMALLSAAAPACVPAPLASSLVKAAMRIAAGPAATTGVISAPVAALAEGVLKSMLLNKLKVAAGVLLLLALLGVGGTAGALSYRSAAEEPGTAPQTSEPRRDRETNDPPERKRQARAAPERKPPIAAAADKDDRLRPGDLLDIRVPKTYALPDASIKGVFQVEASGKVALGPGYGRREVKGLTLEEAEEVIQKHLSRVLKDPVVSVTRPVPAHSELERRIQQLEMEVRTLRALVEELRKKARD